MWELQFLVAKRALRCLPSLIGAVLLWTVSGSISVLAGEIGEHRVALIIGNNDYKYFPTLGNAVRDARAVKQTLLGLGWKEEDIVYRENLSVRDIGETLQAFRSKMRKDGAALFFYAGHGVQDDKAQNFLIAADARIGALSDLPLAAISVSHVVKQLEESNNKIGIVILDACRTPIDPAALGVKSSGRSGASSHPRGLARIEVPDNTTNPIYVVYSTQSNRVAEDGPPGGNSIFTSALVRHLPSPGLQAELMFKHVFAEVVERSGQMPNADGWLRHEFYFAAGSKPRQGEALSNVGAFQGAQRSQLVSEDAYERSADGVNLVRLALKDRTIQQIQSAADGGDAEANYLFGVAKWLGVGTGQNATLGRKYLQKSAGLNFRRAVFAYGSMLWLGEGGSKDQAQAVKLWEASATQRFVPSMIRLARYYAYEAPDALKDPQRARSLWQKSAPEDPDALAYLADMVYDGAGQQADPKTGIRLFEEAVKAGSGVANLRLANLYRWGFNVDKNPPKALSYYLVAAELGSVEGMVAAGKMFLNGDEVPIDIKRGVGWLQKAALNYNREAQSLLVKAYIDNPGLNPGGWSLDEHAMAGAKEGFMDGMIRLVSGYRNGSTLTPKDLAKADQLAKEGLTAIDSQPSGSEAAWPLFRYALVKARLDAANNKVVGSLSAASQAELEVRWGKNNALKRFTVPAKCRGKQAPFDIYLWDSTGPDNPATLQFEWLRAARECTVSDELSTAFQKLYKIARENNVSFTDLTAYALSSQKSDPVNKPAGAPAVVASNADGGMAAPRFAASGLMGIIGDIARFEQLKRRASTSLRSGLPPESLADQLETALSSPAEQADRQSISCDTIKVMSEDRSKKAGEAAEVVRLDLICKGVVNAMLLLPDEPEREAILYVNSRAAASSAAPMFTTRYYISRAQGHIGVSKSLHDIDGDGKPDTFGVHFGGVAEPSKALPLTTGSM